jgi:predicted ATPase
MIALQAEYWPGAKRSFQPIDIEYLSCECRKYHSYVNGTKQFEGKNRFKPGMSACLTCDIGAEDVPAREIQTQIHVLAGGPCSGKTTLIKALEQAGHRVELETAECILSTGIAAGSSASQLREDPVQWQREIIRRDFELFDGLAVDQPVFTDTSFIETLVFSARAGIELGPNMENWLRRKRYQTVFFLEPLHHYASNEVRMETSDTARQISEAVCQAYQHFGYEFIHVPALPVIERLSFIQSALAGAD